MEGLGILGKRSMEEFFSHQRANELIVVRSAERGGLKDLALSKIEKAITHNRLLVNNLSISRDEHPVDIKLYSDGVFIDAEKVCKLLSEDCSIIFRSAHHFLQEISDVVDMFGSTWNCDAQGNLYISRAEVNATYPHFDPHELFIFQLLGSKEWKIFDQKYEFPDTYDGFDPSRHRVGQLQETVLLEQGDVLFLPRGMPHQPIAKSASIHLSVGLKPVSVGLLLEGLVRSMAEHHVEFRRLAVQGISDKEVVVQLKAALALLSAKVEDKQFPEVLRRVDRTNPTAGTVLKQGWLSAGLNLQR